MRRLMGKKKSSSADYKAEAAIRKRARSNPCPKVFQ
jgi:hypothetical protein